MDDAEWVCVNCSARYAEKNPPCRQCAGEEFAKLEQPGAERITDTETVRWVCAQCGQKHIKNNPPCNQCGNMQFEQVRAGDEPADDGDAEFADPEIKSEPGQSFTSSIGDILFNKSLTRQLIDLELLIITGFTWVGFLLTEAFYHHWRLGRDEAHKSQYSYDGKRGEGVITKVAKVLFWLQIALIVLGIVALMA